MPGLYPNPSAAPENFKIGDTVKYFINENEISPYVGKVTEICPGTQKVWVEWPIGGNRQMDPETLILVPPEQGKSPIKQETGYSSYEKQKSKDQYGTLTPKAASMAKKILSRAHKYSAEDFKNRKLAQSVTKKFASDVVDKLSLEISDCKEKALSDIQTYQRLYPKYANICSDGFIKKAIEVIYNVKD